MERGEWVTVEHTLSDNPTERTVTTGTIDRLSESFFVIDQGGELVYVYYSGIISYNPVPVYSYTKPEPSKYGVFLDMRAKK